MADVFSSVENGAQRVYNTQIVPPPIFQQHFIGFQRYFNIVSDMLQGSTHQLSSGSEEAIHPYYLMRATLLVENAVRLLRKHLAMTNQQYEEYLLLTLLHPLQYMSEKGRFSFQLTKFDVEYLYKTFAHLSETFFTLLALPNNALLSVQSYLFYLTAYVSEQMGTNEGFIESHINFLKHKIELLPQISTCLQTNDLRLLQRDMETIWKINAAALTDEHLTVPDVKKDPDTDETTTPIPQPDFNPPDASHLPSSLFEKLGLNEYFPQKLTLQHALQIREDTLFKPQPVANTEPKAGLAPHAFVMVQKILSFDHRCRMAYHFSQSKPENDSESDSDSESDDDDSSGDSIHPMDCLLALLHCSDNFLRQDLLCRLSNCQLALPLLLPNPSTGDCTLLLWAMRSIVREFKQQDKSTYAGRLISYPAPFVSFLRIGHHTISKSETLNGVISNPESDIKTTAYLGHNYPGAKNRRIMVDGLVEISWYLPGDNLFNRAIAFTNLRGDAINSSFKKQIAFLCEISTMHVALVSDAILEDAPRQDAIELLKLLSEAPGGVILVKTKSQKGLKDKIARLLTPDLSLA